MAGLLFAFLLGQNLIAQTIRTVGSTVTNYTTLKIAFDSINAGKIKGVIILRIVDNTNESAVASLKASGTGSSNYTSVTIYPTGTRSISGSSFNGAIIEFDGADNVTIDGRIDQTGTSNSLSFINTNTGSGASAIRFANSAENNTVKYCNLSASSTSSAVGIVTFSGSTSGNGNDNNIVEYCNLTSSAGGRPYNGIVSSGTTGRENNGCIIRNNNIYNTFQTGVSSNGINITTNSVGFTISGNSIYESTDFISPANLAAYNAIRISTNTEHTITGNYVGGREPQCGGAAWSFVAQRAVYFCGIYASAGTGTASTISNNTIANIDFSSKEDNPWDGIFLNTGNFEVNGNTIGAPTGVNSIISRTPVPMATTTIVGGVVTSINLLYGGSNYSTTPPTPPTITFTAPPAGGTMPTATAIVTDGVVTGITIPEGGGGSGYITAPAVIFDGQSNNYSTSHGMIQASTGTVNITGNNLGSITTVGSNHYSHGFESIYVRTIATATTLTNNLIGSLTTEHSINVISAAASSLIKQDVYGIYSASTLTTIVSGNTVANLTNAYAGINSGARTRGIQTISGSNTISNNTVFNLTSASKQSTGGSTASAIGISQLCTTVGTTQLISGNTVYNIKNTNPTDKSFVRGIYCTGPTSGTHAITGNFVHSLSIVSTDNNSDITGIDLAGGNFTCANNIVNLGTGITGGYVINGIWEESGTSLTRSVYFNTVYLGGTVTSGSSATAAFRNQYTGTRNYRNNVLFNARSGGGTHYAVFLQSAASLTNDYNDYFVNGTNGILGYLSSNRTNLTQLQTATGQDLNSKDINPVFAVPGGTSAINYFPSATLPGVSGTGITTDYYNITRHLTTPKIGALEQDGNVWQGATSTDFNTASNWVNNTVPGTGADIIFATSPTNDCVLDANRTLGSISNGSSKNLVVNGKTLTVNGSLNFTSSGKINTSTALSVVKFAGTAAQTIPGAAFESNAVRSLILDNSNGFTQNGDLTVTVALTLTSGVLTVGANTFTITGTLSVTGGTINASNAGATLDFANSSAMILPASVFSADITNLTISGTGGLTAGSDITVNGVLNLAAANPSDTKGLLEMVTNTLTLGGSATITGTSDVTGIVKRQHSFTTNIPYAFGSQFTTIAFIDDGSRPTWISLKISIGTVPGWSSWTPVGKVKRYYNIAVSANASTAKAVVNMRYLLSELDGTNNDESKLVFWHKYTNFNSGLPHEHGKSNQDFNEHHIGVTGIVLSGAATENLNDSEIALAYSSTIKNTWKGEVAGSQTLWEVAGNWTAGHVPLSTEDVLIPSGLAYYPSLTSSSNAIAQSIEIESGASITANAYNITIAGFQGAWINDGNFYPGTGKVTFNHGVTSDIVTIGGTTNFYDIEAGENTTMQPVAGCILRIAGAGTAYASSIVDFSTIDNTVEWNGSNQTIVNPSGMNGHSGYFNLILSGSGTKIMPSSTMNVRGNLAFEGTASATAAGILTIGGNLVTEVNATFNTGAFSHTIAGDIYCDGTITAPSGGSLNCSGNFYNTKNYTGASGSALICANFENSSTGIFSSTGSTLTCNGTFSNDNFFDGTNSTIAVKGNFINNGTFTSTGSTVTLNGTSAQTVEGTTSPSAFNNLTISNSQGVSLLNNTTTAALTISTDALLTVSPTKNLTASGTTTLNSAQCLVLKSDASGTASFIDNGTISGSGTAKIERYITPYDVISDLKFHFLSCPIGTQAIEPEFIDLSSSLVTDFYKWNEADNVWVSYRKGDWLLGENPDYFLKNPAFTESNFMQGSGYMVAYPSAFTKNFIGVPATSTSGLSVDCYKTSGGWNLVGNPFPSSINWNSLSKSNVDATLYYYDNSIPAYKYYNTTSGGMGGATQFISPMQGFMVHASATGSLGMANGARTHSGQDIFYKDEPLTTNILDLKVERNGKSDYARICFYEQATENFDGEFDAYKIFSYSASTSELYSKTSNNTSLAINTLPLAIMNGGSVPVSFKVGTPGNFTLSAEKLGSFAPNTYIMLEDKIIINLDFIKP